MASGDRTFLSDCSVRMLGLWTAVLTLTLTVIPVEVNKFGPVDVLRTIRVENLVGKR